MAADRCGLEQLPSSQSPPLYEETCSLEGTKAGVVLELAKAGPWRRMIPKEQKGPVLNAMGDLAGQVPSLNLGKKLSVPQDLMMEELSLHNNRGSLLFQQRQRRVQRFTFELAANQRAIVAGSAKGQVTRTAEPGSVRSEAVNGPEGQENFHSELNIFPPGPGGSEDAHSQAAPVERARTPSALAPGYTEPLKGVPPEKFNHTAIPKGYRCPWQEFISYRNYHHSGLRPTPVPTDYRSFNKTPVPFGGPLAGEIASSAGMPFAPELISGLELLRRRPNFNRVAQGWVRHLPESEEL
ncbi:PREDICTED: myozenin-3 [Chrysochloris asiatica]|uniref:Myozenin-3 n=1 Tax=Chrysochloris asiatica TaxID=185453 RepID=A0A9B0TLV6_CHRAS|nr:PREDICTED: myozenin-3 [Chrysochloris asiatica]